MRTRTMPLVMALALVGLVLIPGTTLAHGPGTYTGELIADGSNSIGNVYLTDTGRIRVNFTNTGSCPAGISTCFVQVRYWSTCLDFWCWWDPRSSWLTVPAGQDFYSWCPGAGPAQQWKVEFRTGWTASTTKTVEHWAEDEWVVQIGGSGVYKLLAKFLFNVTNNSGYRHGTKVETATYTFDYSASEFAATSGSYSLDPFC